MKTLIVACSARANELMKELKSSLDNDDPLSENITATVLDSDKISVHDALAVLVKRYIHDVDGIVFLCAAGVAVKAVAPYVNEEKLPRLAVLDELGRYCISLLSGLFYDADEFAGRIGELVGANTIITSPQEADGRFDMDEFARKNGLVIGNRRLAKEVSVRIIEGQNVYFCSDFPVSGFLPEGLIAITQEELYGISMEKMAVHVTNENEVEEISEKYGDELSILKLVPRNIAVGIVCKKNTSVGKLRKALYSCMDECGLDIKAVNAIAGIKKDEQGIAEFGSEQGIDFRAYSEEELEGELLDDDDDFIESITGVSNACERCAVMLAREIENENRKACYMEPDGSLSIDYYEEDDEEKENLSDENVPDNLICAKKVYDGVAIALAEIECNVSF